MVYRTLGRTGLRVSRLGFGAMRLPMAGDQKTVDRSLAIPKIFEQFNLGRVYGLWDAAKKQYASIGSHDWDRGKRADACVGCGQCEEKCPQKIPIRRQLKDAHEMLS